MIYTNVGDYMRGINLNKPIIYKYASLRFFEKNEYHINRVCNDDVLLLVYEGVLRFLENGKEYEVTAGHYHIQQHGSKQIGHLPSDSPKYLYVHFWGEWADNGDTLNYCGEFDYILFKNLLEKMDRISHENHTQTEQVAVFFDILSILYRNRLPIIKENDIAKKVFEIICTIATIICICTSIAMAIKSESNFIEKVSTKQYDDMASSMMFWE